MADHDVLAERYLAALADGDHHPAWLVGQIDLAGGLDLQLAVLDHRLQAGERLAGFKVGLTSERARRMLGADVRPFGYILASGVLASGATVPASSLTGGAIEAELCWTVGERLSGPVTAAQARSAMATVAAGYELNERRPGSARPDLAMAAADRMSQWGIVEGTGVAVSQIDDINDVTVTMTRNGEQVYRGVSRDELDDHFTSLARLAAVLGEHGRALEPGHKVITGAFARFDAAAGDHWEASYSGIGSVALTFGD